jgi:atypical dual specificity phosphatase
MSDGIGWLTRRQRDGGIDRISLPEGIAGSLWLCGKHAIAPELGVVPGTTRNSGWLTVVCLTERHELADRYPDYVAWLERAGERTVWWPIPDMHAPSAADMVPFVDGLVERLRLGETVLVHCGAGIGRAGTTAACVLVRLGASADEAERIVAHCRPMAGPEVGAQRELVRSIHSGDGRRDS